MFASNEDGILLSNQKGFSAEDLTGLAVSQAFNLVAFQFRDRMFSLTPFAFALLSTSATHALLSTLNFDLDLDASQCGLSVGSLSFRSSAPACQTQAKHHQMPFVVTTGKTSILR